MIDYTHLHYNAWDNPREATRFLKEMKLAKEAANAECVYTSHVRKQRARPEINLGRYNNV
jgi:hypothetical protein